MSDLAGEGRTARSARSQVSPRYPHDRTIRHGEALEWAGEQTAAVHGTATSDDGTVRATVDPTGILTGLELAPQALRELRNTELARLITSVVQRAASDARDQVRDTCRRLVDEGTIRRLPSTLLSAPNGEPDGPTRGGIGTLLAGFVTRLTKESGGHEDPGVVVADVAPAPFAHTLDADHAVPQESHQRNLTLRIRAFINRHLSDPNLCPTTIAAAHHISVSYLHRLFHTDGLSVMASIRRQRLERARNDLADPALCAMPIHQIAARWGFPRPPVFTRAFRAAYGISPSDYRHHKMQGKVR